MNTLVRLMNYLRFSHLDSAHFGGSYEERERFNTGIFISPKRDFLFTKNEKCGNNTARRTLQNLASPKPLPPDFRDVNRWAYPMLLPSDLGLKRVEELNTRIGFKFAIVRNPYARTLSCYLDKFSHGRVNPSGLGKRLGADAPVNFAAFVERICAQTPAEMDPHWRIQYHNIYCERVRYDCFVKFENYEEEFGALMQRFFGRSEMRNVRKGQHKAELKLGDYYTPEIARAVRDKYAIDFETFGYSVGLPA
jgi:Sulfotransferase family